MRFDRNKKLDLSEFSLLPEPPRPALGVSFSQISIKTTPGYLHGLEAGGRNLGLRAVIQKGDVLLGFAGHRIETTAGLGIVLHACEPNRDYEAVVLRLELVNNIPVGGNVFKVKLRTRELWEGIPS